MEWDFGKLIDELLGMLGSDNYKKRRVEFIVLDRGVGQFELLFPRYVHLSLVLRFVITKSSNTELQRNSLVGDAFGELVHEVAL